MVDVFTSKKRSEIMSRVKGRGNRATELRLIEIFRLYKITGWRRNAEVFGRPDFAFKTGRVAVFVDGCFWHDCPIHGGLPKTNRRFWREKLRRNKARDRLVNRTLKRNGWKSLRLWQHDLRRAERVAHRVKLCLADV